MIGWSSRCRRISAARSAAEAYRLALSFSSALATIVSISPRYTRLTVLSGLGSTCWIVCTASCRCGVSWYGNFPASNS